MRPINPSILSDKYLVLMTIPEIIDGAAMQMADHLDSFALVFIKTNHFLGLSGIFGLRLGSKPKMTNGIWIIDEDPSMVHLYSNLKLRPNMLSLEPIE